MAEQESLEIYLKSPYSK